MKHIYNNLKANHTIGVYVAAFVATIVLFVCIDKWKGTRYVKYNLPKSCGGCIHFTPTPTSNVGYTPAPTPTPSYSSSYKEVHTLSGKLLFQYRESVYASDFDGKNSFKLIDLSKGTRLVWWSANRIYYYAYIDDKTSALIRKDLDTQKLTTLFTFSTNVYDGIWSPGGVTITKDERYVVYVDNNSDIFLYDTTNNTHKLLLKSNNSCKDPKGKFSIDPDYCFSYGYPRWAPDDRTLIIQKGYYEGGGSGTINPLTDSTYRAFKTVPYTADLVLNDNTYYDLGSGYGRNSIYAVNDFYNPTETDIFPPNKIAIYIYSMAISSDRKIAFVESDGMKKYILKILNIADRSIQEISPVDTNAYLKLWLPDNKTLIYTDDRLQVWTFDVTTHKKTPLDIYADTIYGYVQ